MTLICAGGDQSFCAIAPLSSSRIPADFRTASTIKKPIKRLSTVIVDEVEHINGPCEGGRPTSNFPSLQITKVSCGDEEGRALDQDFLEEAETIFQSPACLSASFLKANHMPCSHKNSGVDFAAWRDLFATIGKSKKLSEIVEDSVAALVPKLREVASDYEALRIFLVLPLVICSKFIAGATESADAVTGACEIHDKLHIPFAVSTAAMDKARTTKLLAWLMTSDKKYMQEFVGAIKAG